MPTLPRILTTTALCLAASVVLTLGWAVVQLCTARVHILGLNGKICPCAWADIRRGADGAFLLYMPDAIGQELYVNADSLCDKSLAAVAYVLPWFGRRRTRVDESGYAVVKKLP